MSRIAITAANTMVQLQKQLDVISHNVANVSTTGYKKQQATFHDLLYQQVNNQPERDTAERLTPPGIRVGTGAKIGQIQTVLTQGSLQQTERALDFALTDPKQFFKVLAPNGEDVDVHYTRNGAFYLTPVSDTEVALVTSEGHQVLDENDNPIIFNANLTNVKLNNNGMVTFSNETGAEETFALGIVQVNYPQSLESRGNHLFGLPEDIPVADVLIHLAGADRSAIAIKHKALEQSNVDLAEEMTNLIQTQRAYQFQARAITLADQIQGLVNSIR